MKAAPKQIDLPLAARRAAGELAEQATAEPIGVAFHSAPEVGGLWAMPKNATPGAAVLYLFGGGYVLGSPASRRKTAGHIASAATCAALVANYRLAPEHVFPAALDDAVAAYAFLAKTARRIVVVGDSAGGGLAVACGLAIHDGGRDGGLTPPAGVVAISPWADLTCSGASMTENAGHDIECGREGLLGMAAQYLAGHDPRDPLASPAFGQFEGAAPLFCVVGGDEVLLDDAARLTRAAGIAEVDACLRAVPGMQHVFPIWAGVFPDAGAAIAQIGGWIARRIAG